MSEQLRKRIANLKRLAATGDWRNKVQVGNRYSRTGIEHWNYEIETTVGSLCPDAMEKEGDYFIYNYDLDEAYLARDIGSDLFEIVEELGFQDVLRWVQDWKR